MRLNHHPSCYAAANLPRGPLGAALREARLRSRRSGSILIAAIIVVFLVTILGIVLADLAARDEIDASYDWNRDQSREAADAGVDYVVWYIQNFGVGNGTLTFNGTMSGSSVPYTASLSPITGQPNDFQLQSVATSGQETTRVRGIIVISTVNVSIWTNAIFAGLSQSTTHGFFGNTAVAGSVHIHSDGVTNPTTIILQGNGTGGVYNNYADAGGSLLAGGFPGPAVPPTQITPGTGGPNDLLAKFRVRIGTIATAQKNYGTTTTTPNKGTLSAFLSGIAPTTGLATYTGGVPIQADSIGGYDLGQSQVDFPDLVNPLTIKGVAYTDYFDFLTRNAGTSTENALQYTANGGNLTITGANMATLSDSNGNSIGVSSGVLTVNGVIWAQGAVNISGVTFQGNGTIVSGGTKSGSGGTAGGETIANGQDITISNLMPVGTYSGGQGFPNNVIGLISLHNIILGTAPGDTSMGAFFAENDVSDPNAQGSFAGTIVSQYFDLFNNTSLFYVPELQNHLPPGLPSASPVTIVTGAKLIDYYHY